MSGSRSLQRRVRRWVPLVVVVLVAAGVVSSPSAFAAAPANDDFVDATVLSGDAGSLIGETNEDASAEVGEPNHNGGAATTSSVWYEWTPSADGNAVVEATSGPYFPDHWDVVMGVYTGSSVDALTEVTSDGGLVSGVEAEFRVTAGTTYHIAVDRLQPSSDTGSFDLTWSIPAPANDDFVDATALSGDSGWLLGETNEWASAEAGEPDHDGRSPTRSVWYELTPPADGTAVIKGSTLPASWDYFVMAAYTGVAVDGLTEVTAAGGTSFREIRLEFAVLGGTTYHLVVDGTDTWSSTFDLTWALSPPTNDDFDRATVLTEDVGTLAGETTEGATPEIGEPTHAGLPGTPARSVWYEWTPVWDGSASIDIVTPASPDDWDSALALYTGSALDALVEVTSGTTTGDSLHLQFEAVGGTTYRFVVDGHDDTNWGSFDLSWANDAYGGTWVVTKTTDSADGVCDADCSLREAVVAANNNGGNDTITLPEGTYELTLWLEDDLHVAGGTGTTSIIGVGAASTVIDASGLGLGDPYSRGRVISNSGGLELVGITITGGYTVSGLNKDGAGVLNQNGTLAITDSIVEGNWSGENGGGIANLGGAVTITNSIIRNNSTDPPEYSTHSEGGGVYNTGVMTIVDTTIESNESSDEGGGVATSGGELTIEDSLIANNVAEGGGGVAGGGVVTLERVTIVDNDASGYFGRGGGVLNGGDMTIVDSVIDGNETRADRFNIQYGSGGGVNNQSGGTITITATTVSNNLAIGEQWDTSPLLGGRGGGIANVGGTAIIENSTISGNQAAIADRWDPYTYAYLDGGGGGGVAHMPYAYVGPWEIYLYCPVTVLDGVTVTNNTAARGGGVNSRWEDDPIGLYGTVNWPDLAVSPYGLECADFYVTNSIIAGNTATVSGGTEDSWGDYTSLGHNLVGVGTGAPSDGPGDVTTGDALLGPLGDNGGTTSTHAPLAGSPAINSGDTDKTVDQRGVSRPQGPADDIGAVEVLPVITPGSAGVTEGDSGSVFVDVPLTLSFPSANPVTVAWETFDFLADPTVAIGGVDYAVDADTVTFAPGETTQTVTVEVLGDLIDEPDLHLGEWGFVRFSNPSANATLELSFFGLGIFVIIDDDPPPTITPGSTGVPEGDAGSSVFVDVPVTLSNPSAEEITVDWETFDNSGAGVATADVDYVADSGMVTFAAGETTQTVSIEVKGDDVVEPPLYFGEWGFVRFSNPSANATLDLSFFGLGIFVIIDDD